MFQASFEELMRALARRGVICRGVPFTQMDLTENRIGGVRFEDCDFRFVKFHRSWIAGARFVNCDFRWAEIRGATVRADFINCDFTAAYLTGTTGYGSFQNCNLSCTDWADTNPAHWAFSGCHFPGVTNWTGFNLPVYGDSAYE